MAPKAADALEIRVARGSPIAEPDVKCEASQSVVSIIIGFTPFHLLPISKLLEVAEGRVYVFHPMIRQGDALLRRHKIDFLGDCDKPGHSRWLKYLHAGRQISQLLAESGSASVYVPHPLNPIANYAFFHHKVASRIIYQDGLANYCDSLSGLDSSFSTRLRVRCQSAAIGLPFRMYGGHLSGVDCMAVEAGYFTHPELVVRKHAFRQLRPIDLRVSAADEAARPTSASACLLFLDQPVEERLGTRAAESLRRMAAAYVNSVGLEVIYKPHYAQKKPNVLTPTWRRLDRALEGLPAETLIERLNVVRVVGFFSSALANIAIRYPEVRCEAMAAERIKVSVDRKTTDMSKLLESFGVQIINADSQAA